jgi:ATP-dependent DNA helicase RecG
MRTPTAILDLLPLLEHSTADDLEDQDLDFKQWNTTSLDQSVKLVVEMAVCMANGGGGSVVFGVHDKLVGRQHSILGVPPAIDINRLRRAVYDSTDPKITPVFEEISVPEGTGRLLLMQIHPGLPPYTDTSGTGKVRIGKDCQPLTGTLRRRLMVETGETDPTAPSVPGDWRAMVSPVALEKLRHLASQEKAPRDLLSLGNEDFLASLGCLKNGSLNCAGLLLCGKSEAISAVYPGFLWNYLRMESDTSYIDQRDGREALPVALDLFEERIASDNPIRTLELGLVHAEIRAYPPIALREILLNAFGHADYRLAAPVLVKQFPGRLEISNPGSFIGGISTKNILHHPPVARNPALIDALTKLRLVNRSNLGIGRIYESFLIDGKEPPIYHESGDTIIVTLLKQDVSPEFRAFVAEEGRNGRILGVDELLVLQFLLRHSELETIQAAAMCQRPEETMRAALSQMERDYCWIERGGTGRGTYWRLARSLAKRLLPQELLRSQSRIDLETAKTRIMSILKQRSNAQEPGLSNAEIRSITSFNRDQVNRLMRDLRHQHPEIVLHGEKKSSRYYYEPNNPRS